VPIADHDDERLAELESVPTAPPDPPAPERAGPPRRGWWRR
jgi:hypothetical protein